MASALATLYLRRGDTRNAQQVADALARRLPDEALAHNLLGAVKAASRQPAEARAAYARAVALNATLAPAQLNLARLDAGEGQLDAARQRLAALLKQSPRNVQALTELARVEIRAGRSAEALPLLEKARALAPSDMPAGLELLALQQKLNKPAAALALAKQLVLARPEDPAVLGALGRAHLIVGEPSGARAAFATLARLAGTDAERLLAIGALQLAAGAANDAGVSAEKALAAKPGLVPALILQVDAEVLAGNLPRAENLQRALAGRTGNGAEALRLAGDIALARQQPRDAARHYRAAFDKAPSSRLALLGFNAAFRAGDGDRGVALLEGWLRTHPDDLIVLGALAEGQLRLGRLPAARSAYEAVLARVRKDVAVLCKKFPVYGA